MYLHRQALTFAVWSEFLGRLRVHDITIWNMRPETGCCLFFCLRLVLQADGRMGPYVRRRRLPSSSYPVLRHHILWAIERHVRWPICCHDLRRKCCTSPKNGRRLDVSLNAVFHRHMPSRSATGRKEDTIRAYVMQYRWDESGVASTLNRHYVTKPKVCPAWCITTDVIAWCWVRIPCTAYSCQHCCSVLNSMHIIVPWSSYNRISCTKCVVCHVMGYVSIHVIWPWLLDDIA